MAISAAYGPYGDPDTGGLYCSEACADRHAEDQEYGIAWTVEGAEAAPGAVCDRPDCITPLA